jgi:hypothetical protein
MEITPSYLLSQLFFDLLAGGPLQCFVSSLKRLMTFSNLMQLQLSREPGQPWYMTREFR